MHTMLMIYEPTISESLAVTWVYRYEMLLNLQGRFPGSKRDSNSISHAPGFTLHFAHTSWSKRARFTRLAPLTRTHQCSGQTSVLGSSLQSATASQKYAIIHSQIPADRPSKNHLAFRSGRLSYVSNLVDGLTTYDKH